LISAISNLSTRQKLIILVGLGFLLRLYAVFAAVTISVDSVGYIRLASEFLAGNYSGIMDTFRPPLYPLLISIFSYVFQDIELSARIVSLVFGTLVIPFSFYFARFISNEKIGLLTAFFVAFHPYLIRFSGDVLTESTYHFMLLMITFLSLRAVVNRSILAAFLAGVFIALGYVTKPGAIVIMPLLSFMIIFYNIRSIKRDWGKRLLLLLSSWGIFMFMALPYLLFLSKELGSGSVSGKYDVWVIVNVFIDIFIRGRHLGTFIQHFPEAMSLALFPFFIYGLYRRFKEGFPRVEVWLLVMIVFYCFMYIIVGSSKRYLVHLMPFTLIFVAMGFCYFEQYLYVKFKKKAPVYVFILLALITLAHMPVALAPLKANHLPEKLAGEWILEHDGEGVKILTRKPIVTYYAKGRYQRMRREQLTNIAKITEQAKSTEVVYLAGYVKVLKRTIVDFSEDRAFKELVKVKTFKGKDKTFVVYRFRTS